MIHFDDYYAKPISVRPGTSGLGWTTQEDEKEQSRRQAEKDAGRTTSRPAVNTSITALGNNKRCLEVSKRRGRDNYIV